jgi:molybdopterin-containing oxidoreductase family iron-sulfur binding subunit
MSDATESKGMDRRRFLSVVGVTGAGSAVLSGCSSDQVAKLVPYLVQDENQVPGIPTVYASSCTECSAGCGLHVVTREARPIKLEGNPDHPVNAGKLCARGQAGLQGLYHPDRLRGPMRRTAAGGFEAIPWEEAMALLAQQVGGARGRVAVLSGAGPGTFDDLLGSWAGAAGARVVRWEPFGHEPMREANRLVFGRDDLPAHDFAAARYILSFGADFLETWLSPLENQRGFAASHGFRDGTMARHVAFAARMDLTGLNADAWHAIRPGSEAAVALAMAGVIAAERGSAGPLAGLLGGWTPERAAEASGIAAEVIRGVAHEFGAAAPGLAVAGGVGSRTRGAVAACAAVNILNWVAGNVGRTVRFGAALPAGDGWAGVAGLARDLEAGQVGVLVLHEANPAYATPKAAGLAAAIGKAAFKVSTASVLDESAALCDLLLPASHALERWDDVRPRAGVRGLLQPAMMPLHDTRAPGDVLLALARLQGGAVAAAFPAADWAAHLKAAWTAGAADPDQAWREALARGGTWTESPVEPVGLAPTAGQVAAETPGLDGDGEFAFLAYPSSMYHDGRGANRPWLLENPDPVTKITWQSWVELHPETARALDVREGEVLRLESPHGTVEAPAYLYAGLRRDVVAMPLGLGHTEYGRYARGRGVNALDLLGPPGEAGFVPYVSTRVRITKANRYQKLAKTEGNPRQLGRGVAEAMPLAYAAQGMTVAEAHRAHGGGHHEVNTPTEKGALAGFAEAQKERTLLGNYQKGLPQWGLAVDLARCTGCSACVTACYAENNIPWVGEAEVLRGRELSWMRIERYWEAAADGEAPEARFVPVMCQHCANAPCEPVCPVYAAYHTPDGLNAQVYNRCVGTRYCSNNCPYKVRYYNWLAYAKLAFPEPLNLQLNPEVTVRARGVMEKCTFCIQRIRGAQHRARLEDRDLRDGDVVTACAQACPSGALVFGDLHDPESAVSRVAADPRGYHVLEDLNVRPSVTYLAKVQHREAEAPAAPHGAEH